MPEAGDSKPEKISQLEYPYGDCYFDRGTSLLTSRVLEVISYQENPPSHDKEIFHCSGYKWPQSGNQKKSNPKGPKHHPSSEIRKAGNLVKCRKGGARRRKMTSHEAALFKESETLRLK